MIKKAMQTVESYGTGSDAMIVWELGCGTHSKAADKALRFVDERTWFRK